MTLQLATFLAASLLVLSCASSGSGNRETTASSIVPAITDSLNTTPLPHPPLAKLEASAVTLNADSTGFVSARVYITNAGSGILTISSVQGSCGCATASVQRNNIQGDTKAMIIVSVNTANLAKGSNNVDYTISSNAGNSPTMFRVVVNK